MLDKLNQCLHDYTHARKRFFYRPLHRLSKKISAYRLINYSGKDVPEIKAEIRLFVVMRNESLRLAEFIRYHQELGVERIFIIDNNSSDCSLEIAEQFKDVHIFKTKESYVSHMNWVDILLEKYGVNHWCLLLDVDEFFIYPEKDNLNLSNFCSFLSFKGYQGLRCLMLDMYPAGAISKIEKNYSESLFQISPYFDPDYQICHSWFLNRNNWKMAPTITFIGGPRKRVMNIDSWIAKVPLFYFEKGMSVGRGAHDIDRVAVATSLQGVLFHFKFLNDFAKRVLEETKRKQHYCGAKEYFLYKKALDSNSDLSFYESNSKKYESAKQLEELGCIVNSEELREFADYLSNNQSSIKLDVEKRLKLS